jgi:ABC-type antimicrobial peptide transport system permease subunit
MTAHLRDGIAFIPVRFAATVATGIGLLGVVLAIIGLYGVVAYSVAQRHREIGIRMALGATSGRILSGVLREGMLVTAAGLAGGCVLALATTRLLSSLLIEVSARDPLTFAVLAAILAGVTLAACGIPASRAAGIAPARVIRGE